MGILDKNENSKSEVNILLQMKTILSLAPVFVRDYKVIKLNEDCKLKVWKIKL